MKNILTYAALCGSLLAIVILIWVGYAFLLPDHPLIIQGEVEATEISVASKVYGRIEKLSIREGDSVQKGQLLVSITSPEIEARLKQAQAAVKAARSSQDKVYRGTREEDIRASRNMWEKAIAASEFTRKTRDRIIQLYNDGVVSAQKRDEAEAQWQSSIKTEKAAKATYDKALTGARTEDKHVASALTAKAVAVLAEVRSMMSETRLKSPINGEITSIIADYGELISPGYPVITVVDLTDIWVTFNLREDLLKNIRIGTVLDATFPALGEGIIKLKVSYISALGDFATWHATKASGDFDLKTFEIRARSLNDEKGLRPGMSAIVPLSLSQTSERAISQ